MSDSQKSRIASLAVLFVLIVVSLAGILFWSYGRVPSGITAATYQASIWTYPVGLAIISAWLFRLKGDGVVTLGLALCVFYLLAVRMKGLLVYPGTFESWYIPASGMNIRLLVAVLVGCALGWILGLRKPADASPRFSLLIHWAITTVFCAICVILTAFYGEPNQTFAPNQPIGILVAWVGASIGLVSTHILERNEEIDAALRHSMR